MKSHCLIFFWGGEAPLHFETYFGGGSPAKFQANRPRQLGGSQIWRWNFAKFQKQNTKKQKIPAVKPPGTTLPGGLKCMQHQHHRPIPRYTTCLYVTTLFQEKQPLRLFIVPVPNCDRFSQFFHLHI